MCTIEELNKSLKRAHGYKGKHQQLEAIASKMSRQDRASERDIARHNKLIEKYKKIGNF